MVGLVVLLPLPGRVEPGSGAGARLGAGPIVGLVVVPGLVIVGLVVLPPRDEPPRPGVGDVLGVPMDESPAPGDPDLKSVVEPGSALLGTVGMPIVPGVVVPIPGVVVPMPGVGVTPIPGAGPVTLPAAPGVAVLVVWAKQMGTTAVSAVAAARAINLRLNVIACAPLKVVRKIRAKFDPANRALTPISAEVFQ